VKSQKTLTGSNLYTSLSRCALLAGIAFQAEGRKGEAAFYYWQGITWAEESLSIMPTSEGYQYLAANIALSCCVRPFTYALVNIGKVEKNVHKALVLNPQNLAAQYIIAVKNILAPWPIGNTKRGASVLREILTHDLGYLEREDLCNIYLVMAVVCKKEKKADEEMIWQERALALYPTNRFKEMLLG
jgi:tetratricopeptide (TPR) repeat protein